MEGRGKFVWRDGRTYDGSYKDGKKTGHGVLTLPSGMKFEGEWRNNQENGSGKLIAKDGTVLATGTWQDGKFIAEPLKIPGM